MEAVAEDAAHRDRRAALANRVVEELALPAIFTLAVAGNAQRARASSTIRACALVSFTGSSAVGRDVAHARRRRASAACCSNARATTRVVVAEDADLDLVVPAMLFGAVGTAGQRCTTTRRLIVHEARAAELERAARHTPTRRCASAIRSTPDTLMGPLIDAAAVAAIRAHARRGRRAPAARIVCGGARRCRVPGTGSSRRSSPARADDWPCVQRETFAPILYVMTFATTRRGDRAEQRRAAGPVVGDLHARACRRAEAFLAAGGSDCGIANVNIGTSGAEIGGAFGGEKETGGGREAGSDAWKAYMRRQTNTINWSRELPLAQGIRFGAA